MSPDRLQQRLGYTFQNSELLTRALTHRSANQQVNYERLEFLGDALLGAIIANELYQKYPKENEGRLTRLRATLVRQEALASIAQQLKLGEALILSTGEMKSGGHHRASILADVLEAIIGAIYLDSQDFSVVQNVVLNWMCGAINKYMPSEDLKDAKSRLQEWLQARRLAVPLYDVKSIVGDAPNQHFEVECMVADIDLPATLGEGTSRRIAEQVAAQRYIDQIAATPAISHIKPITIAKSSLPTK